MAFFDKENQKKKILTLWLLNPFSLILIYVYSNFDIIPTTLTVLSLLLALRKKYALAALCLGIGAGFKAYPLIFLPILFLYAKGWMQKVQVLTILLGLSFIISAPFYSSIAFRQSTLVSGLTTRILQPTVSIGFGEGIIISLLPLGVLLVISYLRQKFPEDNLLLYYFAIPLLILSFIHYHIQWLLWIIPFVLLLIVRGFENIYISKSAFVKILIFAVIVAFVIPLLYNDSSMSVALLRPISSWFLLLPMPCQIMNRVYDVYTLQSILHSLLAVIALVLSWQLFKERKV